MYKFKTKYKNCLATIDELQFVRQGNTPPNSYKDNAPKQKQANYNFSTVAAVSGGKYIPITNTRLTGKGVNRDEKILNEYDHVNNEFVEGHTIFGSISNFNKKRLLKKNNIIYDLLN